MNKFLFLFPLFPSFRPISVTNIGALVFSDTIDELQYKVSLFKCEKDFYSLDRLKEHVAAAASAETKYDGLPSDRMDESGAAEDDDDIRGKIPEYNDEWKFNEVSGKLMRTRG